MGKGPARAAALVVLIAAVLLTVYFGERLGQESPATPPVATTIPGDGAPTPEPDGEPAPEEDDEQTGAELLQALLAQEIPPVAQLPMLTDLEAGLKRAREHVCPLVHILVRGKDDPEWLRLQRSLDQEKLPRAVMATCVLVISAQPDLPLSPTIAVHSTEPVLPEHGSYERGKDGVWRFHVADSPSCLGYTAAVQEPPPPTPTRVLVVRTPEGQALLRHRIVMVVPGADDVLELGRRLWSVVRAEYELDDWRQELYDGKADERVLGRLLGDGTFGLLTADERIRAVDLLLRGFPRTAKDGAVAAHDSLWWAHRALRVILGEDVRDPTELLALARQAWPHLDSPERQLIESQVELMVFANRERALELLESALRARPDSPCLHERVARCALVGARDSGDAPAVRARYLERARQAIGQLAALEPRSPDLFQLERGLAELEQR